jgi:hypothetical protein
MTRALLVSALIILAACQPQPVTTASTTPARERAAPAPPVEMPAAPESGGGY